MNIKLDDYNINGTYPSNYLFILKKIPLFVFSLKRFPIPSLLTSYADVNYRNINLKNPPDSLRYGDLNCEFFLDEYFKSYYEIYTWLYGNVFGENEEFSDLYSDANLLVYNNSFKKVVLDIHIKNLQPINIFETQLDNTSNNDITFNCTFEYDYFTPDFKLIS